MLYVHQTRLPVWLFPFLCLKEEYSQRSPSSLGLSLANISLSLMFTKVPLRAPPVMVTLVQPLIYSPPEETRFHRNLSLYLFTSINLTSHYCFIHTSKCKNGLSYFFTTVHLLTFHVNTNIHKNAQKHGP